ncbi:Card1-like endonuclease domain-containing protein [Vibrio chaetopteri]|uniref:Card1-like endonuclease domain-containing protein n=1 Tax=Vibrio chaetopteri TaxID=3016528 RepID=UPI003AB2BA91
MLTQPHTQVAIWQDNPTPIVTPLLQPDNGCVQLVVFYESHLDCRHIKAFCDARNIDFIAHPIAERQLPLEQLNDLPVRFINLTQGNIAQKDQLLSWGRTRDIPAYWVDHETDMYSLVSPDKHAPVAIVDRLNIKQFLELKGFSVTGLTRQTPDFNEWVEVANTWVRHLAMYEKGFRALNHLARTANEKTHVTEPLSLGLQNNQHLKRIIGDLQQAALITKKDKRLVFKNAEAKQFCHGIWLEYYAYGQLKKLAKQRSDIQDIAMSVNVQRGDPQNPIRNEIDVIALINNRLYIVECKTGVLDAKQSQLALYRLDTIADLFGPLTQGALLSFDAISPLIKRRAKEIDIRIVDYRNMTQLSRVINDLAERYATPEPEAL